MPICSSGNFESDFVRLLIAQMSVVRFCYIACVILGMMIKHHDVMTLYLCIIMFMLHY